MLLNTDDSGKNELPSLKSLKAGNKIQNILRSQKIVKRKKEISVSCSKVKEKI